MTIDRIREPGGWTSLSQLLASELEELDARGPKIPDAEAGGAYAPSTALVIGGSGILDANAAQLDCGLVTVATKSFANITQNRVNIINGWAVTDTITLTLAAPAGDLIAFTAFFDVLNVGAKVIVKNDAGVSIVEHRINRALNSTRFDFERRGTVWRVAHIASNNNRHDTAGVVPTLPDDPSFYDVTNVRTFVDFTVDSTKRFRFNTNAGAGQEYELHFAHLGGGADIRLYETTSFDRYRVSGAGERGTILKIVKVQSGASSAYRLVDVQRKRIQPRTFETTIHNGTLDIDPLEYAHVFVNAAVGPGDVLNFNITNESTSAAWSEGQEVVFVISALQSERSSFTTIRWKADGSLVSEKLFGGEGIGGAIGPLVNYPSRIESSGITGGSTKWRAWEHRTNAMFIAKVIANRWCIATTL